MLRLYTGSRLICFYYSVICSAVTDSKVVSNLLLIWNQVNSSVPAAEIRATRTRPLPIFVASSRRVHFGRIKNHVYFLIPI